MGELIAITEHNGSRAVSARELHRFLEATERFANWFDRQIQYGFVEGQDYVGCKVFNALAKQELQDYALTIDCAKEISMLAKNQKGKQARQYFIECERQAKNPVKNISRKDLAMMVLESEREKERLQIQNEMQSEELRKQAPKVEYFNEVLQSESTYNTNQIAKELGMSAVSLNRLLHQRKIQYNQSGTWLLYHQYQNKGYTKTKTFTYTDSGGVTKTSMQTVWTEAGRQFIHQKLRELKTV